MTAPDCVILAAGRGSRLKGIVPQYFKPLLIVDGQALIVSAINAARSAGSERIIVVVAPENVATITSLLRDADILDDQIKLLVQHTPRGPGAAFIESAPLITTERVLLLMADNVFGEGDIERVIAAATTANENMVVGTQDIIDVETAKRFTRVTRSRSYEGQVINDSQRWEIGGPFRCWVGPIVADVDMLYDAIADNALGTMLNFETELKIGPYLGDAAEIFTVPCTTHDVGDAKMWGTSA